MKLLAALLLALVAWTGSFGALSSPRCAMAAARCDERPCCRPKAASGPSLKTRLACCDIARTASRSPSPAATPDPLASLVSIAPVVAVLAPRTEPTFSFVPATTPRPRGPPLYLRNRSLLL